MQPHHDQLVKRVLGECHRFIKNHLPLDSAAGLVREKERILRDIESLLNGNQPTTAQNYPLQCNSPLAGTGEVYNCNNLDCSIHGERNRSRHG